MDYVLLNYDNMNVDEHHTGHARAPCHGRRTIPGTIQIPQIFEAKISKAHVLLTLTDVFINCTDV